MDTIPVEESSISVDGSPDFEFDAEENTIRFSGSLSSDSIQICFRTISPRFYQPVFNRSMDTYARGRVSRQNVSSIPIIPKEELFAFSDFETYGAITRGVSFGNRQNLFVNSALNLQLDGQLSENLYVSASITDQNIPYQPEGNTQQIRDFDNVYIKLYNDDFDLTAGDVVLTNPVDEGYFLQYYKNVQGLSLNYKYDLNEKWRARSSVSGSAAKGQFYSAQLDPIEGVQGPYRLKGPNGERFIIVLANSERVFIDGELMERGFDRDYVIDYNLGEITFSNSVVITRFTRIRVDYEYAEQYYSRSNLNASQEIANDRLKFYFNYYQEKDNPGSTLSYDLGENDLDQLDQLGDNRGLGLISGVDSVGYIEDAVLYQKRDTLIGGSPMSYYAYTSDPELAEYRISFAEVGFGQGQYVLQSSTANGRVYEWVAPVGGADRGNYAPVRFVPLPNKKQMFVVGGTARLSHFESFTQELALSNQDRNLYSELDDDDNVGYAWRGRVSTSGRQLGDYKLAGGVSFEAVQTDFQWIDRFRPIEYDRNWGYNIFQDTVNRSDNIVKADFSLAKNPKNRMSYRYSYRNRSEVVDGHQHDVQVSKEIGPFLSRSSVYYMNNNPLTLRSKWVRFEEDVKLVSWGLQPGYAFRLDQQKTYLADTLSSSLMHYYLHNWYLESGDSLKTKMRFDYIKRFDQLPQSGELLDYTEADEFRLGVNTQFLNFQTISVTGNYRKVKDQINQTSSDNILGRLDWQSAFLNEHIRQNVSFSTANTRELKREFIFIAVPTGEGTHTWRDENEDGIQDLNEFYEAVNVDERNYVKIFTPTDEYINAFQSTLQQSVDARFPKRWESEGAVLRTLSKLSVNANTRLNYKSTDDALINRLNPFGFQIRDTTVLSAQSQKRYSMFYNRNGTGLAFDLNRTNNQSKSLLTNGFELRQREDWLTNVRYTFRSKITVRFQGGIGETRNESDFLESRNFVLSRNSWAPELIWQPTNGFRISGRVEVRTKNQREIENPANSSIQEYALESTWIRSSKGNLNAQVQWISIDFTGEANTYLGYELLEGLQPGQNQKWNLNWQQSLNRGLQLTIQYNGRNSAGSSPVHTGTMQLTAFF